MKKLNIFALMLLLIGQTILGPIAAVSASELPPINPDEIVEDGSDGNDVIVGEEEPSDEPAIPEEGESDEEPVIPEEGEGDPDTGLTPPENDENPVVEDDGVIAGEEMRTFLQVFQNQSQVPILLALK